MEFGDVVDSLGFSGYNDYLDWAMADVRTDFKVFFYSGYKGRETPRAILIGGREHPVEKILWRRRVQEKDSGERYDLFRCRVAGREITLRIGPTGEGRILGREGDSFLPQK